jgi:hypothetical protein
LKRDAGREDVKKHRGRDKAQNMRGRRNFGAWVKVTKIKSKRSHRAEVKIIVEPED